jgi:uncharacterized paraquat-inducible protein A
MPATIIIVEFFYAYFCFRFSHSLTALPAPLSTYLQVDIYYLDVCTIYVQVQELATNDVGVGVVAVCFFVCLFELSNHIQKMDFLMQAQRCCKTA